MHKATRHVIIDTDIGSDIDDSFAISFLLKLHILSKGPQQSQLEDPSLRSQGIIHQPKIQIKLITTCTGDSNYRAQLVAQLLQAANLHQEIQIGFGAPDENNTKLHAPCPINEICQKNYFEQYDGLWSHDGVEKAVELIMSGDYTQEPIMLLSLGPTMNICKMLQLEPKIAERVHLIGMQGSFKSGYRGKKEPHPEYNTAYDIESSRQVLVETKWKKMTIVPLDTCGILDLKGKLYQKLVTKSENDPLLQVLFTQYKYYYITTTNIV
jgi:inosine-uridine nucleoside N-ribohydrolase